MQKKLVFRGESLSYELKGSGLPVMLLHGFTEDRRIWNPLLTGMENKYLWILPDLPGSGQSTLNNHLVQLTDFADLIPHIMDQENIKEMVLIGHSMGGYISLAFTQKFPEKVKALGLFHSTSYADSKEKKEARDRNMTFINKNGTLPFLNQAIPALFSEQYKASYPEEIKQLIRRYANFTPDSLVQYLEAMKQRPDTKELLESLTKPMLFIMGVEDKSVPLQDILEQCHLPRISYIHILTRSAHMGMIEETVLCTDILDHFLTEIPI